MSRNYKKKFAGFLAMTIVLTGFSPAFTVSHVEGSSGLDLNISGAGRTEGNIDTDVFNVELPVVPENETSGSISANETRSTPYDFIMDPHGLISEKYKDKKIEPNKTLYFANHEEGAAYDFSHTSDALVIRNKSTMNVDVELTASLSNMDGIKLTRDGEFVDDTSASVYLSLLDSSGKTAPVDKYGSFLRATLKGSPKAYKAIFDTDDQEYKYGLKSDAELKASGIKFADYTFRLTGACNPQNGWSDLSEDIAPLITVVWSVSPRLASMAPSIGKTAYAMTKGKGIAIDVDLGAGDLAAKGVKMITFVNSTGAVTTFPTSNYTLSNERIVINKTCITNLVNGGVTSRKYTIIFDDKAETKVDFVLSNDSMAPSIEYDSYDMVSGKEVQINVDLGSGDLAASGIKMITFDKGGESVTFPSSNYTFAGGRLTINSTCITNLIKGGVTSREYTIIFNDNAETEAKFTLNTDGNPPSIANASNIYTMIKDSDVTVDVDLGTGYLEAKGIKAITFTNATGEVVFPTSNYKYADGQIVINKECINKLLEAGLVSREYTITFNNVAETKEKIVLKAENKAPSIVGDTKYTVISGRGVAITLDLGSGESRASGIKEITFMKNGVAATFPTSNYRFENGKLIITSACIDNLIKGGLTSREYTITFDNGMKVSFTLGVDGTAPSIDNKAYTMVKNTDVVVNINEGTGSMKATGIKMITFVKNGVITTFPTTNYSYTTGRLTINKSCITSMITSGLISREYTITFNNQAETKVNIVLTAQNKAPSITGGSTYKMVSGSGVAIPLDLGSGQSMATGIKSIIFVNAGVTKTFPSTNYRLESDKLVITRDCITNLLKGGLQSREYTITFNNGVSAKFTLTR